jgi:hypothetical protein
MGEEYPEDDAGDVCGVDEKRCSLSGAIRGVGVRSIGVEETTEVSSGFWIEGTAIMEGERRHYKR